MKNVLMLSLVFSVSVLALSRASAESEATSPAKFCNPRLGHTNTSHVESEGFDVYSNPAIRVKGEIVSVISNVMPIDTTTVAGSDIYTWTGAFKRDSNDSNLLSQAARSHQGAIGFCALDGKKLVLAVLGEPVRACAKGDLINYLSIDGKSITVGSQAVDKEYLAPYAVIVCK